MRRLGLVLIPLTAALAVFALVATSSAFATELCSAEPEAEATECPAESSYPTSTSFTAEGETSFFSALLTLSCSQSSLVGITTSASGEPLAGGITGGEFNECTDSLELGCGVEVASFPGGVGIEAVGGGDGELTLSGSELSVTINCEPFLTCTYSAPEGRLEITGGEQAGLRWEDLEMTGGGSELCPSEFFLGGDYEFATPSPLFVAGNVPFTKLCKEQKFTMCLNIYKGGDVFQGQAVKPFPVFRFEFNAAPRKVECTEANVEWKLTAQEGAPLFASLESLNFGECNMTLCTVKALNTPYLMRIRGGNPSAQGNSKAVLTSSGPGDPEIQIECGAGFKCVYADALEADLEGGNPGKLKFDGVVKDGKGAKCGPFMRWETSPFSLTKPGGFWVSFG